MILFFDDTLIKKIHSEKNILQYFVFDMSVPDGLIYIQDNFRVFTRQSEYEIEPSFYDKAEGVWIDAFNQDWVTIDKMNSHLKRGKKICVVSPELHKRPHKPFWEVLSHVDQLECYDIMLCTDYPEDARKYFNV